jgi:hypothetical protein
MDSAAALRWADPSASEDAVITRPARLLLASAAVLTTTSMTAVPAAAYDPPTALMGDGGSVIPLKNAAMIVRT